MPCVCLSNTLRQWQTFRSLKLDQRKQQEAKKLASIKQRSVSKLAAKQQKLTQKQVRRVQKTAKKQLRLQQRRAQRQAKQLAKHSPKQAPVVIQPKLTAPVARITEETLRIPHQRKALASTATVSQTLTAAISAQMRARRPQPVAKSTQATTAPIEAHQKLPVNVMSMPPIRPQDLKPGSSRADLINAESRLGSRLFGPIPYGHRREFFHDRQNIWIWHEDWHDEKQNLHQMTVRYEVHTSGVYKKISTGKYLRLEGAELDNFCKATKAYLYLIKKYLYKAPISQTA